MEIACQSRLQVAKQRIVITLRSNQVNINSHSGHCLKVAVLRAFLFQLNSNSVWSLSPKSNQDLSAPPLHCTLFTFPFASPHISKFILFCNFFFEFLSSLSICSRCTFQTFQYLDSFKLGRSLRTYQDAHQLILFQPEYVTLIWLFNQKKNIYKMLFDKKNIFYKNILF